MPTVKNAPAAPVSDPKVEAEHTIASLMVAIVKENEKTMINNPRKGEVSSTGLVDNRAQVLSNPLTYDNLIDLVVSLSDALRTDVEIAFSEAISDGSLYFHGVPGPKGKRTGRSAWVYSYVKAAPIAFRPPVVNLTADQLAARNDATIRATKLSATLNALSAKFGKK